jgi:hypothetical protein
MTPAGVRAGPGGQCGPEIRMIGTATRSGRALRSGNTHVSARLPGPSGVRAGRGGHCGPKIGPRGPVASRKWQIEADSGRRMRWTRGNVEDSARSSDTSGGSDESLKGNLTLPTSPERCLPGSGRALRARRSGNTHDWHGYPVRAESGRARRARGTENRATRAGGVAKSG